MSTTTTAIKTDYLFVMDSKDPTEIGRRIAKAVSKHRLRFSKNGDRYDVLTGGGKISLGQLVPSKTRKGRYRMMQNLHKTMLVPKEAADIGYTLKEAREICNRIWKNLPEKTMSVYRTRKMLVEIRKQG